MSIGEQQQLQAQVRKRPARQLNSTQIMLAVVIAIGLMLTLNFSARIVDDRNLRSIRQAVLDEIDLLRQEQADLVRQREFARSDDYVASWARSEGRMVREGEILIVPVPAGIESEPETLSTTAVQIETTLPRPDNWTLWWALFFDEPELDQTSR